MCSLCIPPVPDPTLDDDNQSDSDEYEYEVIEEIEEVEVDTDELSHADDEPEINTKSHSQHLTISEGKSPHTQTHLALDTIDIIRFSFRIRIRSGNRYVTRYQRKH